MNEKEKDQGFTQSVKLMLFGGLLMLACIIGGNKLFHFHYATEPTSINVNMHAFSLLGSTAFRINSYTELYITWALFLVFSAGLITVIHRLVKTWNH